MEDRRLLSLSVGDFVWNDLMANGVQDAGEPGIPGAVVEVFSSTDPVVGNADDVSQGTATTDASGHYQLSGLSDGVNYYSVFRPPVGFTFTAVSAGLDDTRDSDANASGATPMFTLPVGTSRTDLDAGLVGAAPGFGFAVGAGATGVAGPPSGAEGQSVATDATGNVYVTGYFRDTIDCDPGPGTYPLTSAGGSDMLVAKYTAKGALVWARNLGGSSDDEGRGIAIAADGSVYATGVFLGTADFDPGPGTYELTSAGDGNQQSTVVCKLDAAGYWVWAGAIGGDSQQGNSNTQSSDIALAADGSVYTTGSFQGAVDFDPGPTIVDVGSLGFSDIFVSKLDADGNFVWAQTLGGTNAFDQGRSIAVAPDGSVVTTGVFLGTTDFDPGAETFFLSSAGDCDVFVSKLDASGNFLWARALGGTAYDGGSGIAVASDGDVTLTGIFFGTADFDPGPGTATLTSAGNSDIFVAQLNAAGNLLWARASGGSGYDYGNGLTVTSQGAVYTTGSFSGTVDFDPGPGIWNLTTVGGSDSQAAFVSHLDVSGNFVGASALGGTSRVDRGRDIAVASDGSVYTTGGFAGTADFDPGSEVFQLTTAGSDTGLFVSRLLQVSAPPVNVHPWQNPVNPLDVDGGGGIQPLDVLLIINYINTRGAGILPLPPPNPGGPPPFLDVSGDDAVTALDVLLVINYINKSPVSSAGQAEGEASLPTGVVPLACRETHNPISHTDSSIQPQPALSSRQHDPPRRLPPEAGLRKTAAGLTERAFYKLPSAEWEDLLNRLAEGRTPAVDEPGLFT